MKSDEALSFAESYPLDYVWRRKYQEPFLGPRHRDMNMIDIYRDILEERLIQNEFKRHRITEIKKKKELAQTTSENAKKNILGFIRKNRTRNT